MAWFPVREKDGSVLESNLYFPGGASDKFPKPFTKLRRWGAAHENRGPGPKTFAKLAVENAMAMGWLNGVRLVKKK